VEAEDLHGGLRVGVVGGFELDVLDAVARKELLDAADEVSERQVVVRDQALDLMEPMQQHG